MASSSPSPCAGPWDSSSRASESSKGGSEGSEGMSLCSIASIRRHIREGVSSTVVIPGPVSQQKLERLQLRL
jgi:hypothetical protein